MPEEVSFEDKGAIQVPEKGNIKEEKMAASVRDKITKEGIESKVREEEGAQKAQTGQFTKDVPQLLFRFGAKYINCPAFNLDDNEASIFAKNLNILIPLDNKMAAFVVIIMITLNKVYVCMDAIQAKFKPKNLEPEKEQPKLPEAIQ